MLNLPVFKIIPLIESYYIEQIGNRRISVKEYRSVSKSIKRLKKSTSAPLAWIFIKTENKETPILLKKSGEHHIFLTGALRLKKAKTEKDLEYWKKKFSDILKLDELEKSLEDILFPGQLVKSLPENVQDMLIKAKGFPVGTKRTWRGKEYKKVPGNSGKGKWVRTYSETESRGAKQAIRNVQRKIMEASTMEDLMQIVRENASRFKDDKGQMLPIVKEFITAAREVSPKDIKLEPEIEISSIEEEAMKYDSPEEFMNNRIPMNISIDKINPTEGHTAENTIGKHEPRNPDEPIRVSIGNEGRINIEDGNHRYFNAIKNGDKSINVLFGTQLDFSEKKYITEIWNSVKSDAPGKVKIEEIKAEVESAPEEPISRVKELQNLIEESGQTYNADINKLMNSVIEGDLSLRAGKYMGRKLTKEHKEAIERSVSETTERLKVMLGEITKPIISDLPDESDKRKRQFATGSFEMEAEEAETLSDNLNEKISITGVEFTFTEDDGEITFYAEIDRDNSTENIIINPYDLMEMDKPGIEDLFSIENKDIPKETPKTDYEEMAVEKEKRTPIKPDTPAVTGEDAQKSIEEANPDNRQEKTLEVAGTLPEPRTEDEVLVSQEVENIKPIPFTRDITLNTSNEGMVSGKISGIDTSVIDHREILLTSYKSIQKAGENWKDVKPDWIPEIDYDQFNKNSNSIIFTKLSDGKYLVPISQKYKPHGSKRKYKYAQGPWIEEIADNLEGTKYAIMSLGQVAATQDFYRKVSKSIIDVRYQERVDYYEKQGYAGKPKKSRIKVMASNKMLYDHTYLYREVNNAENMKDAWKSHNELQDSLKQKTIDMDLMKEEVDNAFSKGNETSYGDSNTSDALQRDYGIKIKRQDGSDISTEDQKYLSDAMSSIQNTFGERNSMNEKFGLKLSFAKGTAMHARKAVGLFVPSQHAIGISDGKGLKKKDPFTGEMRTVDYGDENFGGFVLSHEYAHMMDYYLGSKTGEWYASDDGNSTAGQIADVFRTNMNMKSKSDYINRTCECFARALEQYHAIETAGEDAMSFNTEYVSTGQYVSKEVYDTNMKPLIEKFFQENDKLLKSIDVIW